MDTLRWIRSQIRGVVSCAVFTLTAFSAFSSAPATAAPLDIACAYIEQAPAFSSARALWKTVISAPSESDAAAPTECSRAAPQDILVGPGDIVVILDDTVYTKAAAAAKEAKDVKEKRPRVFLNGFDLGPESTLQGESRASGKVALRFRVGTRSEGTEKFWSMAYQTNGLLGEVPLRIAVGWQQPPEFEGTPAGGPALKMRVTGWSSLIAATLLMVVLVLSFIWALRNSDLFRIQPLDVFWHDAYALRKYIFFKVLGAHPRQTVSLDFVRDAAAIKNAFAQQGVVFEWPAENVADYFSDCRTSAIEQLKSGRVPLIDAAGRQRILIGLGITQDKWNLPRLPYSLAKVQSSFWLTFAVTAAVYLWLVWGEFPALNPSVLGLIAVSAATGSASQLVDRQIVPTTNPSRGFIFDLLTDNDEVQQAHRYQALVVNLMLLVVGIVYVVQHLLYPDFDTTWVGLLALSGASQVVLKQTVEVPKSPAEPQVQAAQQVARKAQQAVQQVAQQQPAQQPAQQPKNKLE